MEQVRRGRKMCDSGKEQNPVCESYGHEVSMTVKDGCVTLLWWAYGIAGDEWVALYRNAADSDGDYISGAWQWAEKGYSYQTSVPVTPGMQARYIKGKDAYKCLARTDPFPALDEAVEVRYPASRRDTLEEIEEALYDKTPEELALILAQRNLPNRRGEAYTVYGTCMLGYREGKYIIDWNMQAYEPYDWIGLYQNAQATKYETYQYVKRTPPYKTSIPVNSGEQIRYMRWDEEKDTYVAVARTNGFKQLKVGSVPGEYPFEPSQKTKDSFKKAFPNLVTNNVRITGSRTYVYNCIAWSLGFNDRWINPAKTIPKFKLTYVQAGCEEKDSLSDDVSICIWANNNKPTHGSRRYRKSDSERWESKLGQNYRITHGCGELSGDAYGDIIGYFTEPKKFMAKREPTILTANHFEKLQRLVNQVNAEERALFDSQFAQLWKGWHSEEFCFESDTECLSRLPSYQAILEMGQAAIPLLVAKLADEQHFFALPLYDALQRDRELKISYQDKRYEGDMLEGEQNRAARTVRLYLER